MTFGAKIGNSFVVTPPFGLSCDLRIALLITLMPSTSTRFFSGYTCNTLPTLPFSSPDSTTTISFFFTCISDNLRRERNDLGEILVAQLTGHRPKNACAFRVQLLVDNHNRVVIKTQIRAVRPTQFVFRAHHDAVHNLALLDPAIRSGFFAIR